jgi:hypothetical protein
LRLATYITSKLASSASSQINYRDRHVAGKQDSESLLEAAASTGIISAPLQADVMGQVLHSLHILYIRQLQVTLQPKRR